MENFVELTTTELKELDGGHWILRAIRDTIVVEAIKAAGEAIIDAGGGLTPEQSADYYRYRGM